MSDAGSDQTAFVSGGSGFVGRRLISRLLKDGWSVNGLARSPRAARTLEDLGAKPFIGDLTDADVMKTAAQGCALVVHLAARIEFDGPIGPYIRDNVEGTKLMLQAAADAGVQRFVYMSSDGAVLNGRAVVDADELTAREPESAVHYCATKARAEIEVAAANVAGGLETVIVRARCLWGAGDTVLLPLLIKQADDGELVWIDHGSNIVSTAHVDNVVEGLMLAATGGQPGSVYSITDGQAGSWRGFVEALFASCGRATPAKSISSKVALEEVELGTRNRFAYWVGALDITLSDRLAREQLNYVPVITLDRGMEELAMWTRHFSVRSELA